MFHFDTFHCSYLVKPGGAGAPGAPPGIASVPGALGMDPGTPGAAGAAGAPGAAGIAGAPPGNPASGFAVQVANKTAAMTKKKNFILKFFFRRFRLDLD